MPVFFQHNKRGAMLLEVIVGTAVFLIFALGIYGSLQSVFRIMYQSRVRIIETAVLNEQIEIMRNLAYTDIGIVNGSPAGILQRTVTTTRSGFDFEITRTIRAIDDPYDGQIGGDPNDTAPVDYKLAQVDIICINCDQNNPLSMVTQIAPRYLEGDPTHGALFVEVFDAEGRPITDADVRIYSTSTDPTVDFIDTTDNQGMLRILDLDAAIQAYHLQISKDNYTSDYTITSSPANPNPTKLPASVAASDVTEISFSIDAISRLNISSIDDQCAPVGSVAGTLSGSKLIGTEPSVVRNQHTISTNLLGTQSIVPMEWDTYNIDLTSHDIVGTIPEVPMTLLPANTQPFSLIVAPNTNHSLWVLVRDVDTKQPVANADVSITRLGNTTQQFTGVGTVRQTDWSGGSGQTLYTNQIQYFAGSGIDTVTSSGNVLLQANNGLYGASGELESSIIDLVVTSTPVNIIWEPLSQPAMVGSDSLSFQIATANTTSPASWSYLGPDGTNTTYYTPSSTSIHETHADNRYLRYKAFLQTTSNTNTPMLSDVAFTYTTSCTPPGQTYFGNLSNAEYTLDVDLAGYTAQSIPVTPSGNTFVIVDLVTE